MMMNNVLRLVSVAAIAASSHAFSTAPLTLRSGEPLVVLFAAEDDSTDATPPNAANDILNSPDFLKRKIDVLTKDISGLEDDIVGAKEILADGKEEWQSQLDALAKEYKNIQNRMNAQSNNDMATTLIVRQMLDVLDNFDRAFGAVSDPTNDEEVACKSAYRSAYDQTLSTFTDLGVEVVDSVGIEFDYEIHQAVMQKPSDEYEEGIVCEELAKGFKIGDTLIRAAMVVVAAV